MIGYREIQAILPHAHPMVLVDRVVSLERGRSAVGLKAITGSELCYRRTSDGHTDARDDAYPLSLLVESFGQTAAVLWLKSFPTRPSFLLFATMRDCRFVSRAFPGEVLRHEVRLQRVAGANAIAEGRCSVEGRLVAEFGTLVAKTVLPCELVGSGRTE